MNIKIYADGADINICLKHMKKALFQVSQLILH